MYTHKKSSADESNQKLPLRTDNVLPNVTDLTYWVQCNSFPGPDSYFKLHIYIVGPIINVSDIDKNITFLFSCCAIVKCLNS